MAQLQPVVKERLGFRPKMNLLMIVLIVLSFALLDQTVVPRIVATRVTLSSDYRSPFHFSYGQVKAFIDLINQDPAPKIITTGDSIINGGGVKNGSDTIANLLQQELRQAGSPYHVYNLGLSGAAPGDIFFVVHALHLKPQDIVVYDLNVSHYGSPPVVFPEITPALSSKSFHGASLNPLLKTSHVNTSDRVEDWLQLHVADTWKLYAYRDLIKQINGETYFGQHPPKDYTNYAPWFYLDWAERTKNSPKRGHNDYPNDDPSLLFTGNLIEMVREAGAHILVFNIPLNQQMIQQFQMVDRPMYDQNIKRLHAFVTAHGGEFRDYEKVVRSQDFTDSLHPMKPGNQVLALQLQQDLAPWLTKGSE